MGAREDLKNRRVELGLTLEDVATIVGVGKSTVRKWETGFIANMKRDKIEMYAKALKVTPIFIMGLDEEPIKKEVIVLSEEEKELILLFRELHPASKKTVLDLIKLQSTPIVQNEEAEKMVERSRENAKRFFEEYSQEETFKKAR